VDVAAADFGVALERADAAGFTELCAAVPLVAVPEPESSSVAEPSAGVAPAAFELTVSPEVVAPNGVGPLAAPPAPPAPPAPARGETDAEDAAVSAAVAAAVAAPLADAAAAAAAAAGEALPSAGKDPPPDAAGRYLGGSLFLAGLLWT
jgi:hypothetical protein